MADEPENVDAAPAPAKEKGGGGGGMMPVLLIILLMPVMSFAMFKFLIIPMIKAEIPEPGEMAHEIKAEDVHVETASGNLEHKVSFEGITANLKGAAQTRFIRVSVVLRSDDPNLPDVVAKNDDRIKEVITSVLRSKTLANLEEPEIKNTIRNQMKQGFEHVLGQPIVEEITIPEFVVQ